MGDLKLDPSKVNPLGAIVLDGATGVVRVAMLVHGMRRRKQKYGMAHDVHRHWYGCGGDFRGIVIAQPLRLKTRTAP
jgi:acetyl-CoA acyltransferase